MIIEVETEQNKTLFEGRPGWDTDGVSVRRRIAKSNYYVKPTFNHCQHIVKCCGSIYLINLFLKHFFFFVFLLSLLLLFCACVCVSKAVHITI